MEITGAWIDECHSFGYASDELIRFPQNRIDPRNGLARRPLYTWTQWYLEYYGHPDAIDLVVWRMQNLRREREAVARRRYWLIVIHVIIVAGLSIWATVKVMP